MLWWQKFCSNMVWIQILRTTNLDATLWAASRGHGLLAEVLLQHGADPESTDNTGVTPLWWAAREGNDAVVNALLECGACPDSKDYDTTG